MGSLAQPYSTTKSLTVPTKAAPTPSESKSYTPPSPTQSDHSSSRIQDMAGSRCTGHYHDPAANAECSSSASQSPDSRRTIVPLPQRQKGFDGSESSEEIEISSVALEERARKRVANARSEPVDGLKSDAFREHDAASSLDVRKDGIASSPKSPPPPALVGLPESRAPIDSSPLDPSCVASPPFAPSPSGSIVSLDPTHCSVFGEAGTDVVRSLQCGSSPATAGLFDGLRLSNRQSSLPTQLSRCRDLDEEDDGECHEGHAGGCFGAGEFCQRQELSRGSNKKKRKIPTVGRGSTGEEEGGEGYEGDEELETLSLDNNKSSKEQSGAQRSDFVIKAPPNVPTTAKAALAKLRYRPPHVSLSRLCLSRRRHARRETRLHAVSQEALALAPPTPYTAPAFQSSGPPPLPPGSGLKGSKALKAAKKVEKDREKEKQRVKLALGGGTITLPNFCDPFGHAAAAARHVRRTGIEIKSGYLTPPASEEGDASIDDSPLNSISRTSRASRPPSLETFTFFSPSSPMIETRWRALQDRIEKLAIARERAIQAKEEENRRRKENEEKDRSISIKDGASMEDKDGKKGAGSSPPSTKKSAATSTPNRPAQPLAEITSNTPSSKQSSSAISTPPPSNRKPPPKKGRKKRNALANNGNPHHIFNYRPSRIPSSALHADSTPSTPQPLTSWPASEEAIAAAGGSAGRSYFVGEEEWLCPRCEYSLFYGEDSLIFDRLVKKRKQTLKVRARAKARAAKTANGCVDSESPPPLGSSSPAS